MKRDTYSMWKKFGKAAGTGIAVLCFALTALLYFSSQWMFDTWSNLTMDELVFHLNAPLDGTNGEIIVEYLKTCVVPTGMILAVAICTLIAIRGKKFYMWVVSLGIVGSLLISGNVVYGVWERLDIGDYIASQRTYSTFIDRNYVDPADVSITFPEEKRNLIYIFLESMETAYSDKEHGGAFEKDVIPELTSLAQSNEDFSGTDDGLNGGYSLPGTTWTVGGMFAQTAGLPLLISMGNNMDTQDHFFPNTIALGDILEQEGYSQALLIGSEADFGGRGLYFSEHGDYEIMDYNYALEHAMVPKGYRVLWGYEDKKLFAFAKETLLELAAEKEPFNLTMLTVDTHFEDGYCCELCPDTFDEQYANVMACSSRQVDEFISWIQSQDFYSDTTIVVVGDHPTMDSDFCLDIDQSYGRRVYTSFINAAATVKTNQTRKYTTFDMFPTTVAALGAQIQGNRLGLGTNLFSKERTLIERYDYSTVEREIGIKSKLMEEMAAIDYTKDELLEREGKTNAGDQSQ